MLASERHALFNAIVASAALVLFAALIPSVGPVRAQAGFAVLGLTALGRIFYRRKEARIVTDERDQHIAMRALQIGFAVFWVIFVEGIVAAYFIRRSSGMISISVLPFIVWMGWAVFQLAHSAALLILYRRS